MEAGRKRLLDAIWPNSCLVCHREETIAEGGVCEACWGSLLPVGGHENPRHVRRIAVGFSYDERMRTILHRFKFGHRDDLAEPLAAKLAYALKQRNWKQGDGILVPVPDHPARRRERGYNPAELISIHLARIWDRPCMPELACRVQYGQQQSQLPDDERRKALRNAFRFDHPPAETKLIVVDDVIHTGTTLSRLALAAKRAGWEPIEAVCLCA